MLNTNSTLFNAENQKNLPDQFNLFTAVVVTSKGGSYVTTVVRENFMGGGADSGSTIQAIPISAVFAGFLGFKQVTLPQPGDRVLCAAKGGNECYLLGSIPQNNLTSELLTARTNMGAGDCAQEASNRLGHEEKFPVIPANRRPTDVVDGEWAVANEFGVLVGMLQHLAQLKGSELAQVQCHLLDDLVRIISHNFQHYTALGEYNVYHDGKSLMAEFGATHQPGETYGRPLVETDSGAPVFTKTGTHIEDDSVDFYKITEDERIKAVERFKVFLGRMGDFLHLFLCRPDPDYTPNLSGKPPSPKPDTGLADLHIATDGAVHLRSVREVFIEKTNWIRVPARVYAPEDPQGDKAQDIEYEEKEKFEWEQSYSYKGNPFQYFLQLRDYVAYVSEKNYYRNFKKHPKDFYVNDNINKEHNLKTINKVDKWTKLEQQPYELRTSGVYLMPNGGITIKDSWNSAIVMEGGNIYIQPAKDLVLQPLRSLIGKVGKHLQLAAKEEVDLSSTEKGFRLKTHESQYFYSATGGIVLEAENPPATTGTPDPETEAIKTVGGIVLKSGYGIYNYAKKEILSYAKTRIGLQSLQEMYIQADSRISAYSKGGLYLLADGSLLAEADGSALFVSKGSVVCAGQGTTALGQEDSYLGVKYDPDSIFIDILKGIVPMDRIMSSIDRLKQGCVEKPIECFLFNDPSDFEKLKFNYLKSERYGALIPEQDAIPSTMAQQDDKLTSLYGLQNWTETVINGTLPYPGKEKFENFYLDADKPKNYEPNQTGKSWNSKAESQSSPCSLTLKSLNQYKINT